MPSGVEEVADLGEAAEVAAACLPVPRAAAAPNEAGLNEAGPAAAMEAAPPAAAASAAAFPAAGDVPRAAASENRNR